MKVSIFGLGYVGTVTSACLARNGHQVIGVDINPQKIALVNDGKSPIIEDEIGDLVLDAARNGQLRATDNVDEAIHESDLSLVCVGTPSNGNGSLSLRSLTGVCENIARVLKNKDGFHLIVIRSTVLPGTLTSHIIPILERESGKKLGESFEVCFNPEFLREGTSVRDFNAPPMTIVGARSQEIAERVQELYTGIEAPFFPTTIEVAETVKYASNIYHALKISFANEMGTYCKSLGIDSHEVMDLFSQDNKLNISKAYLKPGFAFGGSCLPKDLRALLYHAKVQDLKLPLLESVLPGNEIHVQRAIDLIIAQDKKKIGLLGLSFKQGTDDLRESPLVVMTETLLGKGYDIRIYDRNVSIARLMGGNKEYIEKGIPHLSRLLTKSLDEVIDFSEILIIGNSDKEFQTVYEKKTAAQIIIDLVRLLPEDKKVPSGYHGICW